MERERAITGQSLQLTLSDLTDESLVTPHPLPVEWREKKLALAQMRGLIEQENGIGAEQRTEDCVALAGMKDIGAATEDRLDAAGVRHEDHPPAERQLQREVVAEATLTSLEHARLS
jgi:hypothetical protein